MKLQYVLLVGLAGLFFSSCKLSGSSESTPQIRLFVVNLTTSDTLTFYGNELDTVSAGDTILFHTEAFSEFNGILEYYVQSSDTAHVEFDFGDEAKLDSVFASHGNGRFTMNETPNYLYFPFKYIIKKPAKDLKLTLSVLTNASMDYSSRIITIITPAKEKEIENTEE